MEGEAQAQDQDQTQEAPPPAPEVELTEGSPGWIADTRGKSGLTQKAFGEKIGVAGNTVARWERGEMKPNKARIQEVAKLRASIEIPW